jgi:poly(hydroxyalkanoate) depolymerase family esterase
MHPCLSSASQWFDMTDLPSYADEHGFIVIYPETPNMSRCWDVQNAASLTHNGGGDARGIVNMIQYALSTYNGDPARVYAMGFSSGAMMTNVLAGSYPEIFEAGCAAAGVPHSCFQGARSATPLSLNQTCAQGEIQRTPQEWGNFVRNAYPGYTGKRPRMQICHGLADTLVVPQCGRQALDQWSNVLGLSVTGTQAGIPSSGFTRTQYGDGSQLQGYFGQGIGHSPLMDLPLMLRFFGLIQ